MNIKLLVLGIALLFSTPVLAHGGHGNNGWHGNDNGWHGNNNGWHGGWHSNNGWRGGGWNRVHIAPIYPYYPYPPTCYTYFPTIFTCD